MQEETNDLLARVHFLEKIADEYPAHIYIYDRRLSSYVFLNRPLLEFHGVAREQVAANPDILAERIHPDDLEMLRDRIWEEEEDIEFRQRDQNGEWRWFSGRDRVFTRCPETGEPVAMIGSVVDITAIKANQQELIEARKIAEESLRAKSEFLANMSHEIRTPLSAILGFASLLREETGLSSQSAHFIQRITSNGEQLLRLIDDILNLAKFEAGKIAVQLKRFSLEDLIEEVIEGCTPAASQKNLEFDYTRNVPWARSFFSDPFRVRQILTNLIHNAIKFSESGRIEVLLERVGTEAAIRVKDMGMGISEKHVKNLFQPFGQANVGIGRVYGGTGLGLVLSRRLSEALGGRLELTSTEIGKGSVFTVYLPLPEIEAVPGGWEAVRSSIHDSEKCLTGYRVLLAEDSPDNEFLIRRFLELAGAEVVSVADGQAAIDAASANHRFDAIVLDIRMPKKDGFEVLQEIRANGIQTPVVAATAQAQDADVRQILKSGFDALARKPIRRAEFIEILVRLTAKSHISSSLSR